MGKTRVQPPPSTDSADEVFDQKAFENDVRHMIASLTRVKDPLLRYQVCMMIDRLTQQIAALASTGEEQRRHALKAIELN